jgi:hypothetical protein
MRRPDPVLVPIVALLMIVATGPAGQGQVQKSANTMSRAENASPPVANLNDVSWIAGNWRGEALGGVFEETWNAPLGDSMMGIFRLAKNGKVEFYELLTIVPLDHSLLLRLKHFSGEMVGWEEKEQTVDFPLVKLTEKEAYFDGLTFRLAGPDELHIFAVAESENGSQTELRFEARRVTGKAVAEDSRR